MEHTIILSEIIDAKMKEIKMNQKQLADRIAELGVEIENSTISKIKNFKKNLEQEQHDLELGIIQNTIYSGYSPKWVHVAAICQVLGIKELPGIETDNLIKIQEPTKKNADLVTNPKNKAFWGYLNKKFDFFFLGTVSKKRELIKGTMELSEKGDDCQVEIIIKNTKENDTAFEKKYTGKMIISKTQNACYCTVMNAQLAEICNIVFYHHEYSSDKNGLQARLGVATTVSAGDAKRPTCHRVLICKKGKIDTDEKKKFINSQLRMNRSEVMISEENFDKIANEEGFADIMKIIKTKAYPAKPYYIIQDSDILGIENYDSGISRHKCIETLSLLKNESVAHRNNKIGKTADRIIYDYLFQK
ncbi:MAG: hypothetical protein FWG34_01270 [Oscillospiraceae bacterium]|nr:hypothetical protein [Oscillospiraceae bacterium]